MRTSDLVTSIMPCFLKAFKEIENAKRDDNNPHFNSKFASLESVIEQIKKPLTANDLVYVQGFCAGGIMLTVYHISGEYIDFGVMPVPVKDATNPQSLKSSITLLRRAQLLAAFGIAEVDDDGNKANDFKPIEQPKGKPQSTDRTIPNHAPTRKLSEPQVKRAYAIGKTNGIKSMEVDIICQKLYGNTVESLNKEQYDDLCESKLPDPGTANLLQEEIHF